MGFHEGWRRCTGGDWIVRAMDAQGAMFALVGPKG